MSLERASGVVRLHLGHFHRLFSHVGQRGQGTDFDQSFGLVFGQGQVDILSLDPPHRQGELVGQELNEQRVGKLLLDFGTHGSKMGCSGDGWERQAYKRLVVCKCGPGLATARRGCWDLSRSENPGPEAPCDNEDDDDKLRTRYLRDKMAVVDQC